MKRLLLLPAVLLVLVFLALGATPFVLSTAFVKERVEAHLAQMTGQSVTLRGGTSLSLRPYLGISFDDVAVSASSPLDPWITMSGLQARIAFWPLLAGRVDVERLLFVRPRFRLHQSADGSFSGPAGQSILPHPDRASTIAPGRIAIMDGRVVIHGRDQEVEETVLGIEGTMLWPSLSAPISANLKGRWRGASVNLDARADDPAALLVGASSDVSVNLTLDDATLALEGSFNREDRIISGDASLNVPHPAAIAEVLRLPIPMAERLDSVELSGRLQGGPQRLALDEVKLTVGENTARGRIRLQRSANATPLIGGTLAFDNFNLPVLPDDAPTTQGGEEEDAIGLLDGIALDLRLSAETARLGDLPVQDLAASLTLKEGVGLLDIAHAEAFGGSLAGMIELDLSEKEPQFKLELAAEDADLSLVSPLAQLDLLSLQGRVSGTLTAILPGTTREARLAAMRGEGDFQLRDGSIEGISVDSLLARSPDAGPMDAETFFDGRTDFKTATLGFFIDDGVVLLTRAVLQRGANILHLSGRYDVDRGSLAIRGLVDETGEAQSAARKPFAFFIGGTAAQPLLIELDIPDPADGAPDGPPIPLAQ